jgi:hypothetical protein
VTLAHHQNLFRPMFEYALSGDSPIVQHYHADLGWDAIGLSRMGAGDVFVWAPYECGTHRFLVLGDGKFDRPGWEKMVRSCGVAPKDWHLGVVEKLENGCMASGTLHRPGFDTVEAFIEHVQSRIQLWRDGTGEAA